MPSATDICSNMVWTDFRSIMLSERSQKEKATYVLYDCIHTTFWRRQCSRAINQVSWVLGVREGFTTKEHGKDLGMTRSGGYTLYKFYVKTVYPRCVNFTVCKLYLSKPAFKRQRRWQERTSEEDKKTFLFSILFRGLFKMLQCHLVKKVHYSFIYEYSILQFCLLEMQAFIRHFKLTFCYLFVKTLHDMSLTNVITVFFTKNFSYSHFL